MPATLHFLAALLHHMHYSLNTSVRLLVTYLVIRLLVTYLVIIIGGHHR